MQKQVKSQSESIGFFNYKMFQMILKDTIL